MTTSAALGIIAASHGRWLPTASNVRGLNAWIAAEKPAGQSWQWNNPLNTTDRWRASGIAPYGPGISIYPTPIVGALATVRTILGQDNMQGWPGIDASLRRGTLGRDLKANPGLVGNWGTNPTTIAAVLGGTVPNSIGKPLGIGAGAANIGASVPKCAWWDLPCRAKQAIFSPLALIGRWVEVGGGGTLMLAGLAVLVVGATGQSNRIGGAALGAITGGPAGAAVGAATAPTAAKAPARPDLVAEKEQGRRDRAAQSASRTREREARAKQAEDERVVSRVYAKEAREAQGRGRATTSIKGPANKTPRRSPAGVE